MSREARRGWQSQEQVEQSDGTQCKVSMEDKTQTSEWAHASGV